MTKCFTLALSLSLVWSVALAQNVSRLYSREKLEADAARFGEQIRAEYRETILPKLTDAERSALSALKIEVPISAPSGDPFEFYSDKDTVYLPALSLRFYADLCAASAWLNIHGHDGTTVRDYVGVLFREAKVSPGAPLLPVFQTLGVPDNPRANTAVANRADRNFGNTVVFLLAHELGHILKKHPPGLSDLAQRRTHEIEADAFAIENARRIEQWPLGIEFWFDCERIRHIAPVKFPTEAEWQKKLAALRHPVTTERLEALAAAIDKAPDTSARNKTSKKFMADFFRLAAPFAANPIARVAEYSRVRELRMADLKPRKAGFIIPGTTEHEEDFNGLFAVRRTAAGGEEDVVDFLLLRFENEITGGYLSKTVQGVIDGKIVDGALHFNWREGKLKGRGIVENGGETIRGTWGSGEAEAGAGELVGVRVHKKKEPSAR